MTAVQTKAVGGGRWRGRDESAHPVPAHCSAWTRSADRRRSALEK